MQMVMRWVVILLVSGTCLYAAADSSVTYALDACIRIGLSESGAARNARCDQEIADRRLRQAYGLVLPHVAAEASYLRLDELQEIDFGESTESFGTLDNYEVAARVEQLLFSGGQVGAAVRAARAARAYADAARATTEARLIRDIETRFYGVLLARDAVSVREASVEQLEAYAEQTHAKEANGAASEFDLLTAQVRLANEKPKLITARNAHKLAAAELASLLGLPSHCTFTGRLEQADIELSRVEMQRLALANRPMLKRSDLRLQLGREEIVSARSEALPDVRAHFSYSGANAYQFVSFDEEWEWHWNAGVTLNWNVWDGDLTRQKVKKQKAEYEKLVTGDDELRKAVKLDVRQAYLGLVQAREALAASGDSVALAERALAIARTRHAAGLTTYLEFTDANLALSTARLARLQAQHDLAVAVTDARYACGLNLNKADVDAIEGGTE